jgi:hypothetical protein
MAKKSERAKRPESSKVVQEIVATLRREVIERLGPKSTFEQRRDAGMEIMKEVMWEDTEDDFQESVSEGEEVEVNGKRYRRLAQRSSATYYGRFGSHDVEEPLYREVGVHNGPTIKPIELRVGIIEHMTPDMARVVGALSADRSSRALAQTLRVVGHVPPSRAFLADRTTAMGTQIADTAGALEEVARRTAALPQAIASVSCGLDRMSVRMSEVVATGSSPRKTRTEPYQRTPPPPKEHHYRKAWVGSTSVYDAQGNELHTWRVAAEAKADATKLADRVAADVAWVLHAYPNIPVHCIQDAAPELRALPEALQRALPHTETVELIDFEHLMGYLDDVVDACEPDGDPCNIKGWYRKKLLENDDAIDHIQYALRHQAKHLPGRNTHARDAIAAALRYIRRRKEKMRYASFYRKNLPIGSGATESTCWQMQQRVKLPGQSWEPTGLRGVLAIRALVLSERWDTAWGPFAAIHRTEVYAMS